MGTVLHLMRHLQDRTSSRRFSPLLDGDGVASTGRWSRKKPHTCFSPLLDGDGVASEWRDMEVLRATNVSVPFSMGTVLHRRRSAALSRVFRLFQSPSRWGRCCINGIPEVEWFITGVSVPFSMGTVLHPLLNSHILQHLQRVREALSSQIRFLRRTAPDPRILSSPYVSAIVCVLAFFTPLPHVCGLRQVPA
jgi:hypothetical protein